MTAESTEVTFEGEPTNRLETILKRGVVRVGVAALTGEEDSNYARAWGHALAAALFGDASQVEFVTQSLTESFANIANGVVDVSSISSNLGAGCPPLRE